MQITINLPDTLQISEADLRTEIAIALFQQQRITLGSTSQLARLHQIEFQQLISDRGICIHDEVKDLEQDLTSLHRDGWLLVSGS
jgi:predicted HTH domain antitoxin